MNRYIKRIVIFVVLIVAVWFLHYGNSDKKSYPEVTVRFLDVGQADCEVIQLYDGRNVIIDAGGSETADELVEKLKSFGIEKFDYVIATHPHEDHIGGMSEIINNFETDTVYMPDVVSTTDAFEAMLDSIEASGTDVKQAKSGVSIINEDGVKMEFMAPVGSDYKDKNDYSAVLKFTYHNRTFLFTGDAERISENEMLDNKANLKADVLKVGHHGSNSSTGNDFLNAVKPELKLVQKMTTDILMKKFLNDF